MGTLTGQMRNLAADITSSRGERQAWLGALRDDVGGLRADLRAGSRQRRLWVKSLRGEVGRMCGEIQADLRGARRAWQEVTATRTRFRAATSPAKRARPSGKHRK